MGTPNSRDTSCEAEQVQLDLIRAMPAWRKLELVNDAIQTSRQLSLAGLRERHPGEPIERLRRRLRGLVLGEEIAERIWGPLDGA